MRGAASGGGARGTKPQHWTDAIASFLVRFKVQGLGMLIRKRECDASVMLIPTHQTLQFNNKNESDNENNRMII